jgi:hypothetical protein
MSHDFKQFGEASRMYAKYASVVDQMYEAFKADLLAFLEAVRDQLTAETQDGTLIEEVKSAYRSWWIEDDETKDNESPPHVYVETGDPLIIHPGQLTATASVSGLGESERAQISALQTSMRLPQNCKITKAGGIFTVLISYHESDPVGAVTEALGTILKALHDVEKRILAKPKSAAKKAKR